MQVQRQNGNFNAPEFMIVMASALMLLTVFIVLASAAFFQITDNDIEDDFAPPEINYSPRVISLGTEWVPFFTTMISIFMLLVDYKGGRSRHKFFNDRTIEFPASNFLILSKRRLSIVEAVLFFPFYTIADWLEVPAYYLLPAHEVDFTRRQQPC